MGVRKPGGRVRETSTRKPSDRVGTVRVGQTRKPGRRVRPTVIDDIVPLFIPPYTDNPAQAPAAPYELGVTGTVIDRLLPAVFGTTELAGFFGPVIKNDITTTVSWFVCEGTVSFGATTVDGEAIASIPWITGVEYHTGADSQAVSTMLAAATSGEVDPIDETYPGRAYIVATITNTLAKAARLVLKTVVTRVDLTDYRGGTNPSEELDLIAYEILTNQLTWNLGTAAADVDETNFAVFGDWTTADPGDGTKRYTYNGPIYERDAIKALDYILEYGHGRHFVSSVDGKYNIVANMAGTETGVKILPDHWIDGPYSTPTPYHARPNFVKVEFTAGSTFSTAASIDHLDGVAAADIIPETFKRPGINYAEMAGRYAKSKRLFKLYQPWTFTGTVSRILANSQVGDIVEMTTRGGELVDQKVRIEHMTDLTDGIYQVVLSEYDASAQGHDGTDTGDTPLSGGAFWNTAAAPNVGMTRFVQIFYDLRWGDSTAYTYAKLTWTAPADPENYEIELWLQLVVAGPWVKWFSIPAETEEAIYGDEQRGSYGPEYINAPYPDGGFNDWKTYTVPIKGIGGTRTENTIDSDTGGGAGPPLLTNGEIHLVVGGAFSRTAGGAGTGLDADKLDGQHGSYYAQDSLVVKKAGTQTITGDKTFSGAVVLPTTGITGAGASSGLDADKLDGSEGAAYFKLADNEEVLGDTTFTGKTYLSGPSSWYPGTLLTIDGSYTIAPTGNYHRVQGAAAGVDILTIITPPAASGHVLLLLWEDGTGELTVEDMGAGGGNVQITPGGGGGADQTWNASGHGILLIRKGSVWIKIPV